MSWKNSMPNSERFTYDYFFLEYVCRLCWGADGIIELTSSSPKSMENDSTIAEKIQECVGIDVTTLSHPKKVCTKCLNEIEIFTEFKRFCQETDRKLQDIFQKGSAQQKIQAPKVENQERTHEVHEPMILKEEIEVEFSNLELSDSIDDFDDLPLSREIGDIEDRPLRRKRKKQSLTYCNSCQLDLESIENVTKHNLECHGLDENSMYKCFGCEKRYKDPKKRLRHEAETCKELKCGYKCNLCDRFLPKRKVYERHLKEHRVNEKNDWLDDIYTCNKCLKSFESTECLREHMLLHYQKEKKTYVCDICGRVFARRDYLYKHKLVHAGSKMQKCPHCDYRAVQRSSLTIHLRKHTGERPYACDMCPQRSVTSSNLRAHRKRHFGVKAFECKLCDKKFGYKISLEEHMSAVHDRSEAHTCTQCGSTYSRFRGLRRHLLLKHGKKVKKLKDDLVEVQSEEGMKLVTDLGEAESVSVQNTDGTDFLV